MNTLVKNVHVVFVHAKPFFLVYAWAAINILAPYIYIKLCTPDYSLFQLFMSPFRVVSPECKCIRWVLTYSADSISVFQVIVSSYVFKCLRELKKNDD